MGLFKKTPEEIEEKRAKKFRKEVEEVEKVLNKKNYKIFNLSLKPVIELAKTEQEYEVCSGLFKIWINWRFKDQYLKMNQSLHPKQLSGFRDNIINGLLTLLIINKYDILIEYINLISSFKTEIYSFQVPYENMPNIKKDLFEALDLYLAFSLFKLNRFNESLDFFKKHDKYLVSIDIINYEDDYAKEIFGAYNNQIDSNYFIELIESKNEDNTIQIIPTNNYGTYHDSIDNANVYWLSRRYGWKDKPQFTLFIFEHAIDAEKALLEMPFIHKEENTGKLICDRMMEYGYYEVEDNQYEAILGGFDLTLEEYEKAEKIFTENGGKLKNHLEPDANVKACELKDGDENNVFFKEKVVNDNGTYQVYTADTPADAMVFLGKYGIMEDFFYLIVETPQGSFARDKIGLYQEIYIKQ